MVFLSQLGRAPELTRLVILLLLWGNIRMRLSYSMVDESRPAIPAASLKRAAKRKGFTMKRPRSRFL